MFFDGERRAVMMVTSCEAKQCRCGAAALEHCEMLAEVSFLRHLVYARSEALGNGAPNGRRFVSHGARGSFDGSIFASERK